MRSELPRRATDALVTDLADSLLEEIPRDIGIGRVGETRPAAPARIGIQRELRYQQDPTAVHGPGDLVAK